MKSPSCDITKGTKVSLKNFPGFVVKLIIRAFSSECYTVFYQEAKVEQFFFMQKVVNREQNVLFDGAVFLLLAYMKLLTSKKKKEIYI